MMISCCQVLIQSWGTCLTVQLLSADAPPLPSKALLVPSTLGLRNSPCPCASTMYTDCLGSGNPTPDGSPPSPRDPLLVGFYLHLNKITFSLDNLIGDGVPRSHFFPVVSSNFYPQVQSTSLQLPTTLSYVTS